MADSPTIEVNALPVISSADGRAHHLAADSDLGIGTDGAPLVLSNGRIVSLPSWTPLSSGDLRIDRFCTVASPTLAVAFVISGDELGVVTLFDKKYRHITKLPSNNFSVRAARSGEILYVYGFDEKIGRSLIYRFELGPKGPTYRMWIKNEQLVKALLAGSHAIQFSVQNKLYRAEELNDANSPRPKAAGIEYAKNLLIMANGEFPSASGSIKDMDIDEKTNILYLSTDRDLWAIENNTVWPLVKGLSGRIHLSLEGDYLFVLDPSGRVVAIEHPERVVARVKHMAASSPAGR